ncbi:MAG: hypothetical protein M0Z28_18210 [Rhodospirillales bacterium]|nr:hypothetical protein [Rhodospirillales bacterium]
MSKTAFDKIAAGLNDALAFARGHRKGAIAHRRNFLAASALLPLGLAACAGQTQTQLQADVQAVAQGLGGVVSSLSAVPHVPQAVVTQAMALIGQVKADAAQIATALTPNPNVVQHIADTINALLPIVAPYFPVAPAVAAVLQAALALVPVILAAVGKPVPAGAATAAMTPAQARLVLLAAPHG